MQGILTIPCKKEVDAELVFPAYTSLISESFVLDMFEELGYIEP